MARAPFEDIVDAVQQRVQEEGDPRQKWIHQQGFNIVSLRAWLELIQALEIPHVGARHVATVPIEDLIKFDVRDRDHSALDAFFAAAEAAGAEDRMLLRWDCCASLDVKADMAHAGGDWEPNWNKYFTIDDPRAFDIIYEYPGQDMHLWVRPWLEARRIDGFPLEYRVYVEDAKVVGVSSYYPQRPVPATPDVLGHIEHSIAATERIIELLPLPLALPWGTDRSADCKSFTSDFMVLEDDTVVWLEAGPALGLAHPCCFPMRWSGAPLTTGTSVGDVPVALASMPGSYLHPDDEQVLAP